MVPTPPSVAQIVEEVVHLETIEEVPSPKAIEDTLSPEATVAVEPTCHQGVSCCMTIEEVAVDEDGPWI